MKGVKRQGYGHHRDLGGDTNDTFRVYISHLMHQPFVYQFVHPVVHLITLYAAPPKQRTVIPTLDPDPLASRQIVQGREPPLVRRHDW